MAPLTHLAREQRRARLLPAGDPAEHALPVVAIAVAIPGFAPLSGGGGSTRGLRPGHGPAPGAAAGAPPAEGGAPGPEPPLAPPGSSRRAHAERNRGSLTSVFLKNEGNKTM